MDLAKLLIDFSIQAYEDEENINVDALGFEFLHFIENKKTDTQAFIARDLSKLVIAFRGTSSTQDAWTDLQISKTVFPIIGFLKRIFSLRILFSSKTHLGFYESYYSIQRELHTVVSNAMKERNYEIYITGHSLGGALATLAALDFVWNSKYKVSVYTYGAPKVGNKRFVKFFNKTVKDSYRVVNDEDPVPSIPGPSFKHVKNGALIDEGVTIRINPGLLKRIEKSFEGIWSTLTADALKEHSSQTYKKLLSQIKEIK